MRSRSKLARPNIWRFNNDLVDGALDRAAAVSGELEGPGGENPEESVNQQVDEVLGRTQRREVIQRQG
jgi:hypothetical protein